MSTVSRRTLLAGLAVAPLTSLAGCAHNEADPSDLELVDSDVDRADAHIHGWVDLRYTGEKTAPYVAIEIRFVDGASVLGGWHRSAQTMDAEVERFMVTSHYDQEWYATDVEWRVDQ